MMKLDQTQIDSLESVKDRKELCEKIYSYILANKESFKEYRVDYAYLNSEIYSSFDLLISLLLTDNEVISQLIVWDVIIRKDILQDKEIQKLIYGSNIRAKDLLAVLEFNELRDN
ncbi:hypothetical protein B9T31_02050 [Acinetobacter sp. ANC 4558]|uniref:hypothetical protein n=1 Tax=Acinetobacter sp. ANC 4558 TaxID=1977876 RepID=UPI000A353E7B|nr:hypothetical protein [Acinetobacter sp. ANC 4558]OTG88412.1 hypothetical protein B9T31_02050 [Acinetobacter sp. ANC 4558]